MARPQRRVPDYCGPSPRCGRGSGSRSCLLPFSGRAAARAAGTGSSAGHGRHGTTVASTVRRRAELAGVPLWGRCAINLGLRAATRTSASATSIDGAGSTHVASLDVRACGTQAPIELIRRHHRPGNRDAQARARRTTGRSCVTAPARTTVPTRRGTITRARSRSGTWGSRATPRNKARHNRLGGPPRPWSKSAAASLEQESGTLERSFSELPGRLPRFQYRDIYNGVAWRRSGKGLRPCWTR
jgi:hypothetical protein